MTIRNMTREELEAVLGWAAEEGWNPGLEDAAAFFAADPQGFFVNEVGGQLAAAISVVNHDARNAFLGLYICRPAFRGTGLGLETWTAALAHAGGRCVGLDGVPDQQANYARSGFVAQGRTIRFQGAVPRDAGSAARDATDGDRGALMAADLRATGVRRTAFAAAWLARSPNRRTLMLPDDAAGPVFATYRRCREGVKIGPLHADNPEQAQALLASVPPDFGDGPLFVDVPEQSAALIALLEGQGFANVFETARMYAGTPPAARLPACYAIASMELG